MKKVIIYSHLIFLASGVYAELPVSPETLKNTTLGTNSAYNLLDVTDINNTFVITKYWDNNGIVTPKKFDVEIEDLGDSTGSLIYFEWDNTGENKTIKQVESAGDFVVNVDSEKNIRINTDQSGADINHSFAGLSMKNENGVAIYNKDWEIGSITGDFVGNYSYGRSVTGAAIYNYGSSYSSYARISSINGNFVGNYVSSDSASTSGGAIYNYNNANIYYITGDFIGNYSLAQYGSRGGAIYNYGSINTIDGDFIGNYTINMSYSEADGGAIYNNKTIGTITGDFIENYASSTSGTAYGGAIFTGSADSNINTIKGNFIGNYVSAESSNSYGGAIYNYGTIGSITGDFTANYASSAYISYGGAIYNGGSQSSIASISSIAGDFINNYVSSSVSEDSAGGAIYNGSATIGSISGNFTGNYADGSGGAIYNRLGQIESITGNFINNYSVVRGGAIYNGILGSPDTADTSTAIGLIAGDFIGNYVSTDAGASWGGAIYNVNGTINSITGNFIGNYASVTSDYAEASGGAIYNHYGIITMREGSSFTGNYVTVDGGTTKSFEAIYNNDKINLNSYDSSKSIIVNDGINGDSSNKALNIININQTVENVSYGTVEFNSFVKNQTVNVYNGTLKLGSYAGTSLNVNGTELAVPETKASLTNTDLTVKSGSDLLIETFVNIQETSSISIEDNATLKMNDDASLMFDDSSTFNFADNAKLEINLTASVSDFKLNIIQLADVSMLSEVLSVLQSEGVTTVLANGIEITGWQITQGIGEFSSWIVVSSTAVPEPAEWAAILGAIALGLAVYKKRR